MIDDLHKKIRRIFLLLAVLATPVYATEQITFAFQDSDNFPFQVGDGVQIQDPLPGIAVEQVREVAKRLDLDLVLVRLPWKRGLRSLRDSKIDGLFNASYKHERKAYGHYPVDIQGAPNRELRSYSNSYSLFQHQADSWLWDGQTLNQSDELIYAPLGFSIVSDLRKLGVSVKESSDMLSAMKLLAKGKIQGVAMLTPAGQGYLDKYQNQFSNVRQITPPLNTKDYFLMLSFQFKQENPDLSEKIWQTMAEVRDDPAFQQRYLEYK